MTFVHPICTKLALSAHTRDPFYTSPIALLPEIFDIGAYGYDNASAFMTCDSICLRLHCYAGGAPFVLEQ
jgi:hypothetical protein